MAGEGCKASRCWIWKDPMYQCLTKVKNMLLDEHSNIQTITVLHVPGNQRCDTNLTLNELTLQSFMLNCSREMKILNNYQTAFYNTRDHFLALQLALARASKETNHVVTFSDVMICHKTYVASYASKTVDKITHETHRLCIKRYLEFLDQSNAIDEWILQDLIKTALLNNSRPDLMLQTNILVVGTPQNEAHLQMLKLICEEKELFSISVEIPLDSSFTERELNVVVKVETMDYVNFCSAITTQSQASCDRNSLSNISVSERYVTEIFSTFLGLLINNRNELALAKALTSPLVKMSHDGFISLKHLSCDKNITMCQTAISYIKRLELGGQSYAPAVNCPVKEHVKELKQFVEILNRLQDTLEDNHDIRICIGKIVNHVRNYFVKCGEIKMVAIQTVTEKLHLLARDLLERHRFQDLSETKSIIGFKTLLLIRKIVDELSCDLNYQDDLSFVYSDFASVSNKGTPLNVPSVLAFFKTPDVEELDSEPTLRKKIESQSFVPIGLRKLEAGLPWGGLESITPVTKSLVLSPVAENMCNPESVNDKALEETPKRKSNSENAKRTLLADIKNKNKGNKRARMSKAGPKRNVMIKGQQQLTKFFSAEAN